MNKTNIQRKTDTRKNISTHSPTITAQKKQHQAKRVKQYEALSTLRVCLHQRLYRGMNHMWQLIYAVDLVPPLWLLLPYEGVSVNISIFICWFTCHTNVLNKAENCVLRGRRVLQEFLRWRTFLAKKREMNGVSRLLLLVLPSLSSHLDIFRQFFTYIYLCLCLDIKDSYFHRLKTSF